MKLFVTALALLLTLSLSIVSHAFENIDQWNSWTGGSFSTPNQSGRSMNYSATEGFTVIDAPRVYGLEIYAPADNSLNADDLGVFCSDLGQRFVNYQPKVYTETSVRVGNLLRRGAKVLTAAPSIRNVAVLRAGEEVTFTQAASVVDKIICVP
jgi:hypothetical protein